MDCVSEMFIAPPTTRGRERSLSTPRTVQNAVERRFARLEKKRRAEIARRRQPDFFTQRPE
jgi:hypothetical protein